MMAYIPVELSELMSEEDYYDENYYEEKNHGYEHHYPDDYEEGYEMMSDSMSLLDISKACVFPTVSAVSKVYIQMLCICFCFQILNRFSFLSSTIKHTLSFSFGFFLLWISYRTLISHSIIISVVSHVLIYGFKCSTITISVGLLTYLTACEFIFEDGDWARVRSIQMILVMKIISLVSDLENGRIHQVPTRIEYLGFLFSVSNGIYGPWISFSSYLDIIRPKLWHKAYFIRLILCVCSSLICFVLSTCYFDWLLPDDSGSLLFMYKHAVIFRSSHYFIMLMSESFLLAAGYVTNDKNALVIPNRIEVPRSLVEVVIYWNVPMHQWLKTYIFKPSWKYGHFSSIICTYFVSSLLHGLNYQLSGVLLSLALYTYIENMIRKKLAQRLDACVLSKSCSSGCDEHHYTHRFLFVKLINLMFTFMAIYHLSYLGCLIDLRNDKKLSFIESFQRWHEQSYSSHLLALATAVILLFL